MAENELTFGQPVPISTETSGDDSIVFGTPKLSTPEQQLIEETSAFRRTVADPLVSLAKGVVGVPEAVAGIGDIVSGGRVGKALEDVGIRFKDTQDILESFYSPAQQAINKKLAETKGFIPSIVTMVKNPSTIVHGITESAPSMIGGGGIARLGLKGLSMAAPKLAAKGIAPIVAGAAGEGIISGGSTAEQVRQESKSGLLTTGQSATAAGSGALTSVIGVLGGKLAKRLNIADFETLAAGGGIGAAVDDVTKASKMNILKAAFESMINEGVIEELPQSGQEKMASNIATGRPVFEGVAEASAAGMMTGAATGVGVGGAGRIVARRNVTGSAETEVEETPSKIEAPPTEEPVQSVTQEGPTVGESTTPDVKDVKVRNIRKEVEEIIKKDKETADAEALQRTETGTVEKGKVGETSENVSSEDIQLVEDKGSQGNEGEVASRKEITGLVKKWGTYNQYYSANPYRFELDAIIKSGGKVDSTPENIELIRKSDYWEMEQVLKDKPAYLNSNFLSNTEVKKFADKNGLVTGMRGSEIVVAKNQEALDRVLNAKNQRDLGLALGYQDIRIKKEPVTFIGMQEIGKGRPALTLVNNREGSTVTFKPESMEITNPEALPKTEEETSELKISNELPVNLQNIVDFYESTGLNREEALSLASIDMDTINDNLDTAPKNMEEFKKFAADLMKDSDIPTEEVDTDIEESPVVDRLARIREIVAGSKTDVKTALLETEKELAGVRNSLQEGYYSLEDIESPLTKLTDEIESIADGIEFQASPEIGKKRMSINRLYIPKSIRGNRIGEKVINTLNAFADKYGITLYGQGTGVDNDRKLSGFYTRYGWTALDNDRVEYKPKTARQKKGEKVKAAKKEKTITRKKLSPETSNTSITKLSDSDIDIIIESVYPSLETAEAAHDMLGVDRNKYQVTQLDSGYVIEEKDAGGESTTDVASKEIQTNPMFQTLEEAAATPRDTSTLLGASKTMLADVNTYLHTGQGDIVSIAKQLINLLDNVESDPRRFLKEFNEDLASYNEWVDSLNRLAGYITKVQRAQSGSTLDFMGFQNAWNTLVRIYNKWKAARIAHKMKEIEARVDGSDNFVNIENKIPKDVPIISRLWHSSRLPGLSEMPEAARNIINRIIQSELWFRYNAERESYIIKKMASKYSNEQRKEITELGYHIQEYSTNMRRYLKKQNVSASKIDATIRANVEEYLAEQNSKVVEGYKEIRQAYDAWKNRYRDHLIRELNTKTSDAVKNAVLEFTSHGNLEKALTDNGIVKNWDRRKFVKYIEEIREINSWGDADYMTHMMIGNITVSEMAPVYDKNGNPKLDKNKNVVLSRRVITKAKDVNDAIEKAKMYAKEKYESGQSPGKIVLDHSFAYDGDVPSVLSRRQYDALLNKINRAISKGVKDINDKKKISVDLSGVVSQRPSQVFAIPTLESKNILPGENDAFDIMQRYSRIMWKKVSYDPVINTMKREIGNFNPRVKEHLEKVLEASKGKYTKMNEFLDDAIRNLLKLETSMSYTRGIVNPIVKAIVVAKLGYRPAAAAFNLADGMAKVWMEFREHYIKEGWKFLNTPEGRALVESQGWSFGTRFEEVGGHLKARELASFREGIKPLGLFTMPELPIRELNYATAYLYYRDQKIAELAKQGKDVNMKDVLEEAASFAKDSAMVSVWKLQGSNTTAERSEILRSPTGRLFGVFMPYFVRNLEFLMSHKNSPGFWARYIGYQLTMSGPRGFVAMMKSIPLLEVGMAIFGADYWWDRLELWMVNNLPMSGGAASLAGADIVAPATAQFPSSSSTIDTAYKVWKYGLSQIGKPDFRYQTKEGIKQTVIFAKNWWDIIDANIDENGFVLDADGNQKYSITSWWDKTMLANSVTPESKTVQQFTHRIVARQEEIMNEQARSIVSKFRSQLQGAFSKAQDPDIAIENAVETAQDAILKYHVDPERLAKAIEQLRMSKGMRDIANARLINKGQALQMNIDMEEEYPGTLIPE